MTQHDIRFVEDNWESPVICPAHNSRVSFSFGFSLIIVREILQCLLTYRCLVLGGWDGRFGWMVWKSHNLLTFSRYFSFYVNISKNQV